MATELGELYYKLKLDDGEFKKGLDENNGAMGKLAKGGELMAAGIAVAGAATVAFGVSSVKAYMESEDVQAQLTSALQSTHNAAGLYISDLNDQAKALQNVTKFSDEQIGASQALLLTFTDIHGAIFQQATPAILDMATAMHEDLQSATVQVGKALNDPINGMTALRRVGVTFNDTQKQTIAHLQETGDKAGAQAIILQELQKEFGGSAQAAGKTFGGQMDILKNKFNDAQETIGKTIITALTPFLTKLADITASKSFQAGLQEVINVMIRFFQIIGQAIGVLVSMATWLEHHKVILAAVAGVVGTLLVAAFVSWAIAAGTAAIATLAATWPILLLGAAVGAVAYLIVGHWETIKHAFGAVVDFIRDHWQLIITILLGPLGYILAQVISHFSAIRNFIGGVISSIVGFFSGLGSSIGGVIGGVVGAIEGPFKTAFNAIAGFWNSTVGKLSFKAPSWVPGIGGKGFEMPRLPILDTGGIVTGPTLAMLAANSKPEMIIPLDKMKNMGNTFTGNIYLGDASAVREFFDKLNRNTYLESIGVTPQ